VERNAVALMCKRSSVDVQTLHRLFVGEVVL
jgi:hypothetical protein